MDEAIRHFLDRRDRRVLHIGAITISHIDTDSHDKDSDEIELAQLKSNRSRKVTYLTEDEVRRRSPETILDCGPK